MQRIEGMEDTEREKLHELLKDSKQAEEGKLSWMYKNKVDDEEYLLGRRIDKSALNDPEPTTQNTPGALFTEVMTRRSEMDMQVKMREDPLYAIRKKEEETRRRLLEHPIKMKQLQKTIEQQKAEKKHKDKKKKKKKKHKKNESSDDDDDDLLQQYLSIVNRKKSAENQSQQEPRSPRMAEDKPQHSSGKSHNAKHSQQMSCSDRDGNKIQHSHCRSPDRNTRNDSHRKKTHHSDRSTDDSKRKLSRQSPDDLVRDKSKRNYSDQSRVNLDRDGTDNKRRRLADSDRRHSGDSRNSHSKHRSKDLDRRLSSEPEKDVTDTVHRSAEDKRPDNGEAVVAGYGLIVSSRAAAAAADKSKRLTPVMPASQPSTKNDAQPSQKPPKKKLTEDEMAAKRTEMLQNARNRDEQRIQNVKRYREDDKRDRMRAEKSRVTGGFVQPMMVQHASESSVEDRIKRNVYNVQRTSAQLDQNFARR